MIVSAYNPETDNLERTYLTATHYAGVNTLNVQNNDKFVTSKRILIGEMGQERSEIRTTSAPTGTTQVGITAVTSFTHDPDDPIILLEFDQIAFYRASSKNGTYSLITTVTIDVDNADGITYYNDTAGSTTDYYKVKYINSITLADTEFSDPIPATGYESATIGKVIDAVVRRVRDQAYTVLTPSEYIDLANEVNDDLIGQIRRPYRFLRTSALVDTVAGQDYVDLPTDLWKFDRIEYFRTLGGQTRTWQFKPIPLDKFDKRYGGTFWTPSDDIRDISLDESTNRLYIGPTPLNAQTGKIKIYYYKKFKTFSDVGDAVETPNTLIYRYKFLAEYYAAKSESDNQFARLANNYEQKYGAEVVKMQRANRLDVGTLMSMTPPEGYRKRYYL